MHPDDGRVVSNFIMAALTGRDITVYGDGSQTRSFCFVDDLVEGLMRMMAVDDFTGPVNLGNPAEMTVASLAETIIDITGSSSSIVHKPLPADDPQRRRPDISLARQKLDWQPKVGLREGLGKTIAYFETVLSS
jgi:UDP-glucuronate decarboxylase